VAAPLFFVEPLVEGAVLLPPGDSRHALRSLRLARGEVVDIADGRGRVGRGKLTGERNGRAVLEVSEVRSVERPRPSVAVAIAPAAGDGVRWAVQKLAELGVDEVLFMTTERSVRRWTAREAGASSKLRLVAREAAMQSRRPFVPELRAGLTLSDALGDGPVVMLWERGTDRLADVLPERAERVRLLVGPEGGFSEAEASAARDAGAGVASLGAGILRTETAAVVAAALALSRYGRLG